MPYILLILTTLFWSGNFVLSRGMHAEIAPMALSFFRWLVALVLLLIIGGRPFIRDRKLLLENKKFIFIQGLAGVTGFNSLIYLAMQSTTAINAVLLNSCIPVIIVLFSWQMYRERISLRQWLGVMTSFSGVLFIITGGQLSMLLELQLNKGDLFVLLAAILWAFYSANLKRYPAGLHPLAYQCGIVIAGLVLLLPLYLFERQNSVPLEFTTPVILTILYVAIFASVLAFIFWNRAVSILGANIAGPFIHLMPVFSTILAVIFLGENLTFNHGRAILLIFGGILLTTFKPNRNKL